MTLGFLSGSKNFCKLLWVFCDVFVLHGYAGIHWVAKSCTTNAYWWLFRDSHPSLRTLRSAVIKSPNFPLWARLYQHVFCKEPSRFSSSSRCRNSGLPGNEQNVVFTRYHFCSSGLKVIHEKNWKYLGILERCHQPIHAWNPAANLAHLANHDSVLLRRLFFGEVYDFCWSMQRVSPC